MQGKQPANRTVQRPRIATGKVAARGAVIRHKQGVANKRRIANQVGHTGRGMPWRVQGTGVERTDLKPLLIAEQLIELPTIDSKLAAGIEQLAEGVLHHANLLADCQLSA